ncbi:LON peptidase substrate-binding domain-containing protein [Phnomibacter ginsenosidimutans]|uniref:LON peptidase substrate-binding domain-containing protein n=1 Tax=Phnomibacter ginsenosidimutans TaxID=2676868 RepID=UPI001FE2CF3F|nr:LON peptidase substrate-binding domain-containing protein [Phnomibacter ginsenosidimutans]
MSRSQQPFFMNSEDDVDFMPIIPITEGEQEEDKSIVYPDVVPVLPLRNTVLFPGVVIPITVGRDKSIKAVNDAYKGDKLIAVLAQKDSSVEEPSPEDLVEIGTVAKIIKLIKMPDGGTTVILQGKRRFRLLNILEQDPYFKASVEYLQETEQPKDQNFDALVSNIKELATQIIQLSPNIPSEAAIILKNIENPSFLIHFVAGNMNTDVKEKQQILELNDIDKRAEELNRLLHRELQFAQLKDQVTNKTRTEIDKQQREYFCSSNSRVSKKSWVPIMWPR